MNPEEATKVNLIQIGFSLCSLNFIPGLIEICLMDSAGLSGFAWTEAAQNRTRVIQTLALTTRTRSTKH